MVSHWVMGKAGTGQPRRRLLWFTVEDDGLDMHNRIFSMWKGSHQTVEADVLIKPCGLHNTSQCHESEKGGTWGLPYSCGSKRRKDERSEHSHKVYTCIQSSKKYII